MTATPSLTYQDAQQIDALLGDLFDSALNADEFEYCSTLLRLRGIEPIAWDPLGESNELIHQILALVSAPLADDVRLRLLLFLYCHVTEMDDLYSVPMNLLRIIEGGRFSALPFFRGFKKEPKYPASKVAELAIVARGLTKPAVADLYQWMLVRQVRNAFFHSSYSIRGGDFVIYRGEGVEVDGTILQAVPLKWLVPKLEGGINLSLRLIDQITSRRESYKSEKTIRPQRAAAAGLEEVTLLVDQRGLIGFRG